MAKHNTLGKIAELIAVAYLVITGHKILATNYRTKFCEIDIIAKRGDMIMAIEVKYRRNKENLEFAVSQTQQHKIKMGLQLFSQKQKQEYQQYRCDCIFMAVRPLFFQHLKNAW